MQETSYEYYFKNLGAYPLPELFKNQENVWEALTKKQLKLTGIEIGRNTTIDEKAVLIPPVRIGDETHVHAFAVIKGPVIIGKKCSIRYHSLIRDGTVLGDNVVIGNCGEVKNCIVFNGAKIQCHTFTGDSILGEGARIGSGAITGNRRFDQKTVTIRMHEKKFDTMVDKFGAIIGDYSRLGANTVTSPGTLIGKHVWIYANTLVRGFIPSNTLVKLRQNTESVPKQEVVLKRGEEWI